MLAICAFVIALLALVTFAFAGYEIKLDGERLTFGFRHWKKSMPISHIALARKEPPVGSRFGGFGWRIDLSGRFGYIVSGGDAIEVTTKVHRKYVFSCQNPDGLVEALKKADVPVEVT